VKKALLLLNATSYGIIDSAGRPTANPGALLIGRALDKKKNPSVAVGTELANITGVIHYQCVLFGALKHS
jgi:hypothetical protein